MGGGQGMVGSKGWWDLRGGGGLGAGGQGGSRGPGVVGSRGGRDQGGGGGLGVGVKGVVGV